MMKLQRTLGLGLKWNTGKSFIQNYQLFRQHKAVSFARDALGLAAEAGSNLKKAKKKDRSSLVVLASAAFGILDKFADMIEEVDDSFFDSHGWVTPFSTDFSGIIYEMYRSKPRRVHERSKSSDDSQVRDESLRISFVEIEKGIEIGWEDVPSLRQMFYVAPMKIYCAPEHVDAVRRIVADELWEKFKNAPVVVVKRISRSRFDEHDNNDYEMSNTSFLSFRQDDVHSVATSARTEKIAANYARAFAVGLTRSLMLEGPPGSGKSTMAQALVQKLGIRALRLCVEDVDAKFIPSVMDSVKIFRPEAIIIDDFDRCSDKAQESLLELMEWFKQVVKLTVVTVNDKDRLDQALLRPGRFDQIETVTGLDEESVRALLGPYADEAFERVREWPVAYIREYCNRRLFCEQDEAESTIVELGQRVETLIDAYEANNDGAAPFIGRPKLFLRAKS